MPAEPYLYRHDGDVREAQRKRRIDHDAADLAWDLKREALVKSGLVDERRALRTSEGER